VPEIPLLNPVVLRGVVEKFTTPETMIMLGRLPQTPWPYPTATWDVIRGSRSIARPNVPNSEAHIVPRLGRSQESAAFIYLREKKVFEPTTIHWIRQPGQLAATNAEMAVMREIGDLNIRFDNFAEFCIWRALSGQIVLDYPDVQATVNYKFPQTHLPFVGTNWSVATPQQIVADFRVWKRLIARDGRVPAKEAFLTERTMAYIFESFTRNFDSAVLLSDRMKDQYYSSGVVEGFLGLDWTICESIYETDDGIQTLFVPDNALMLVNLDDNRPMEMLVGPTADDDAPEGFTGKFAKTWKDKDPSARQYLLEWIFLPVITRPEQLLYVNDVTATS
jgi:Phage major capsid protein E